MVDEYEAESARIQEELAKSRWKAAAPGKGGLLWPTDGRAGSGYGYRTHPITRQRRMHTGVDVGAPMGQPIIAAAEGLVVGSGWRGGYGLTVVIDHGGGLATLYAHQSRLSVSQGQVVQAGQKIGEIGSTGQSTGPHLHYEVRVNGSPRNPMDWY
jgi:murein DD-endopeptidase MepM/ murein hydrolase activator NlpD